jgi:site-specific DNA-cytosine methylase
MHIVKDSNFFNIKGKTETEHGRLPEQGEVDLLVGGPPCQGYSGLNLHRNGEKSVLEVRALVVIYSSEKVCHLAKEPRFHV